MFCPRYHYVTSYFPHSALSALAVYQIRQIRPRTSDPSDCVYFQQVFFFFFLFLLKSNYITNRKTICETYQLCVVIVFMREQ